MESNLIILFLIPIVALQIISVFKSFQKKPAEGSALSDVSPLLGELTTRLERSTREEITKTRQESSEASRQMREELAGNMKSMTDSLSQQILGFSASNDQKIERLRDTIDKRIQSFQETETSHQAKFREETRALIEILRAEGQSSSSNLRLEIETRIEGFRSTIDQRLKQQQEENTTVSKLLREELGSSLKSSQDSMIRGMNGMSENQHKQLESFSAQLGGLTQSNRESLETLRGNLEEKLRHMQSDNAKQLEQMRLTVDEKLQGTLEKRLGDSFKQVSERLEQVYKGLGEMQVLANGVGDLKKVLTNVKTRGTWGEIQLGAMLEQVLTPEQYEVNVATKTERERVEFAIRMPGRGSSRDDVIWLPIDAKFPIEDYQRLIDAQERSDSEAHEEASRKLELRIKGCAQTIHDKYIGPPKTTDFAILYLPTEGLFAEVVRRPGLVDTIQRTSRVVIAGPTTLWSILNSLQMGFQTLAIEKRSSDVWKLLAAIKADWADYGTALEKVQKKLQEASSSIDKAAVRTRAIGRKLKDVQEISAPEAQAVLMVGVEPEEPLMEESA